jgi:VanZ family protein
VAAIFWASSQPRVKTEGALEIAIEISMNLFHVPLYAALTYLVTMSLAGGRRRKLTLPLAALALALAGACAAADEWHQSFVPGRTAALSDFLLDAAGIGVMLGLLTARARGLSARQEPTSGQAPFRLEVER